MGKRVEKLCLFWWGNILLRDFSVFDGNFNYFKNLDRYVDNWFLITIEIFVKAYYC